MPPQIDIPKAPGKLTTRAEYLDVILPAIKAFLAKHGGDFLYYKVWPTTDEAILLKIARQEEQATSIDVIELARAGEFCSPEQQALARRVSGVAIEGDENVAAPVLAQFPKVSNAYGMIALQKALYGYIAALASPTHTWLLDEINVTEDMCGSDAFTAVNDYMAPINDDTRREAKADYDAHLNSLDPQTKFDKFLPVLLRLGKIKNLFTNQDRPKTDFMEDMIAQMKLVDGANKNLGWGNEITAWRLELAADKLKKKYNDTAIVGHFEKKLRAIEASAERAKAHAQKNCGKVFKNDYQGAGNRNYQVLAARK